MKYPRNNPCYCNSGKKYKKCHMFINMGLTNTSEGWIDQKEVNKRKQQAIGAL